MKKITIAALVSLLVTPLVFTVVAQAATDDVTLNANVTIGNITLESATDITMLIYSGSTMESWSVSGGVFTIVNPGSVTVGSADARVQAIQIKRDSSQVACGGNGNLGVSSVSVPTTAGTYTILPLNRDCPGGSVSSPTSPAASPGAGTSTESKTPTTPTTPKTPTLTPTTPTTPTTSPTGPGADINLFSILSEAANVAKGIKEQVLAQVNKVADAAKEKEFDKTVVSKIVASVKAVASETREKILTFVTYGTPTTQVLGAGERGGVVNSFKDAFGRLPANDKDWEDVVKIGNGRWPSQTNAVKENSAVATFQRIYKRSPNRANAKDDAAVVVMAYGLRPSSRNLKSENTAANTYKNIFKRAPKSASDWDIVRAVAYSGAKR